MSYHSLLVKVLLEKPLHRNHTHPTLACFPRTQLQNMFFFSFLAKHQRVHFCAMTAVVFLETCGLYTARSWWQSNTSRFLNSMFWSKLNKLQCSKLKKSLHIVNPLTPTINSQRKHYLVLYIACCQKLTRVWTDRSINGDGRPHPRYVVRANK